MTPSTSNPNFDKEKAERSRETAEQSLDDRDRKRQGTSRRSRAEEEREQARLPPRGEAKKPEPGGHA